MGPQQPPTIRRSTRRHLATTTSRECTRTNLSTSALPSLDLSFHRRPRALDPDLLRQQQSGQVSCRSTSKRHLAVQIQCAQKMEEGHNPEGHLPNSETLSCAAIPGNGFKTKFPSVYDKRDNEKLVVSKKMKQTLPNARNKTFRNAFENLKPAQLSPVSYVDNKRNM